MKRKQLDGHIIPIDAVVTPCSSRKLHDPSRSATPVALRRGTQDDVADKWMAQVSALPVEATAAQMYVGRGFSIAKEAAVQSGARFYVLSAGLGIVPSTRKIPPYGLTVSAGHAHSIAPRVIDDFIPENWFGKLLEGPYSDDWKAVFGRKQGRILVALSRPYAQMAGATLGTVSKKALSRLRIFGAGLRDALPANLHPSIAPYDERLNMLSPGTRSDFAQRAMLHFARSIACLPSEGRDDDFAKVALALKSLDAPANVRRPRLTDEQLLAIIEKRMRSQSGAVKMLATLRHEDGVACERSRFGRLYRIASERRIS